MRRARGSVARTVVAAATAAMVAGLAGCLGGDLGGGSDLEAIDSPVVISGGGTTGIYYGYGAQLAAVMSDRFGVAAEVTETGGSIANLGDLANGSSLFAFSAADAAADAVAGRSPFRQPLPVQAVARVYDDFVHLVVPRRSSITTIEDLRGKDVSLGAVGSGTELIARRLLAAGGVNPADIDNASLGIDASIEAIRVGEIDAFFWSGGLPTPGVDELAMDYPIRLVALGGLVQSLHDAHGGVYRQGVVPRGTYGMAAEVETMAVPNFLMVRADTPEDLVYETVRLLFEERSEIALHVPAAALLDRARAIFTQPVELHPGALRYYRDEKLS